MHLKKSLLTLLAGALIFMNLFGGVCHASPLFGMLGEGENAGYTLLSSFSTNYAQSSPSRKANISLALARLNNYKINSGKTVSFNRVVGPRNSSNGFQMAKVIFDGEYVMGVGGGVCQASTTLYNAVILAGMRVLEVHSHSLTPSYVSGSFDAMVSEGSADLKFRNPFPFPLTIKTVTDGERATVKIYGTRLVKNLRIERVSKKVKTISAKSPVVLNSELKGTKGCFLEEVREGRDGMVTQGYLAYYYKDKLLKYTKIRKDTYDAIQGIKKYVKVAEPEKPALPTPNPPQSLTPKISDTPLINPPLKKPLEKMSTATNPFEHYPSFLKMGQKEAKASKEIKNSLEIFETKEVAKALKSEESKMAMAKNEQASLKKLMAAIQSFWEQTFSQVTAETNSFEKQVPKRISFQEQVPKRNWIKEQSSSKTITPTKPTNVSKEVETNPPTRVFLTFDDGPSLTNTPKILEILERENINATFFVVKNVTNKGLYPKIIEKGNKIGGHSASHDYSKLYENVEGFTKDLDEMENFFKEMNISTKLFRLPGGTFHTGKQELLQEILEILKLRGYKVFNWNVEAGDGADITKSTDKIVEDVLKGIRYGSDNVILFHDAPLNRNTPQALEKIIKHLKTKNVEFHLLNE